MIINEIKCKTALSKSLLPGINYSLNPYKGCQHKCAYCYVPNVLGISRKNWGSFIDAKVNIPKILEGELKKKKSGIVGISTITDPYQPIERKYELSRICLQKILPYDFPICIQTKSDLILRDIDIIKDFSKAEVILSIGTLDENDRKLLEPYSTSIINRLKVLRKFSESDIDTSVFFGPIYPSINKKNLSKIIDIFIENGCRKIWIDGLNLKPGIQENLMSILKNHTKINHFYTKSFLKTYYFKFNKIIEEIGLRKGIKIINAF
jgi:DNA repair photolyase